MDFSQLTFIIVLLVLQVFIIANSSTLPLPLPLQSPLVISEKKFVLRKCCDPGFIYNFNTAEDIPDKDRCVKYSVSSSHGQKSNQIPLLLGSNQSFPSRYRAADVQIDAGFPRNCTPNDYGLTLDYLDPQQRMGDVFYALSSGHLLVPHRFWYLKFDSYCIDDYTEELNFKKAARRAIICSTQTLNFPESAVDDSGKLRLDFLELDKDGELFASKFTGKRVIRKCCPHNESLDSVSEYNGWPFCRTNQGLVTPFFDHLRQPEESPSGLFFRFGRVDCNYPTRTTQFQLNTNGSLEIQDHDRLLIPFERYCLDDMVEFDVYSNLPSTSIFAFYCPNEELSTDFIEPEFSTDFIEPEFTTDGAELLTDPPLTESPFIPESEPADINNQSLINVPKCCSAGHVMHEFDDKFECHPLWRWPSVASWIEPEATDPAETISLSLGYDFQTFRNVSSTTFVPNTTLSSCKAGQRHQNIPIFGANSKVAPVFKTDSKNQLSLTLHSFVENYWDMKSEIRPFCVDQLLVKEDKSVYYASQVFHCITVLPFKNYRPVILLISLVALLATFVIYFFVPASGVAKLVLKVRGKKNGVGNVNKSKTMAMVLTGRILLCHIISLSLAFFCLAIVQINVIASAENSCVAIGYITYWAFIASFSWLTVYCFDYYRIFRGSFKVSNDTLFIPYSAFGWGVPILAIIATVIAQFQSTSIGISDAFNPNMGLTRCWFPRGSLAETVFFYVPVGVLLLIDIFFFLSLMFNSNLMHCWKRQQGTAIRSNRKNSTASKEHEDLKMATKLFFITGVPWIFEFIAYVYELKYGLYTKLWYFFEFSQLLNTSRGVFIFVNFILLNRDVRKFLWSRIKNLFSREISSPTDDEDNTATSHHTDDIHSTSNGTASSSVFTSQSETLPSNVVEHSYL